MKFFITNTLKPRLYDNIVSKQFELTHHHIDDIFKNYSHSTVCEITKNLNLHYHTVVDCDKYRNIDEFKFDLQFRIKTKTFCKDMGFTDIRLVDDIDGLVHYLSKDFDKTRMYGLRPVYIDMLKLYTPHIIQLLHNRDESDMERGVREGALATVVADTESVRSSLSKNR